MRYVKLSYPRKTEILTRIHNYWSNEKDRITWLLWIEKHSQGCTIVKQFLSVLKEKNSNFVLEEKPYLPWHSSGVYGVTYSSPFSTNEIEERRDYVWYVALLEYDYLRLSYKDGNDFGYEGLWQEIVKANPEWLLQFLDFSIQFMPEHQLIGKIIEKAKDWQFDEKTHEKFYSLCIEILSFEDKNQCYVLAQFLSDINEISYYKSNLDKHTIWIELATQIISLNMYADSIISGDIDGFTESLNSINGALAWFVIKLYEQAKNIRQVKHQCEFFIKKLIAKDVNGYAIIRLFEQYSFLKNRNSLFAQKDLLPYLFCDSKKIKLKAWQGFLANTDLEYAEFREIHSEFYNVMEDALNKNDEGFIKRLTDLYVFSIYFEYHENAHEALKKLERLENHHIVEQILQTTRQILVQEDDVEKVWFWLEEYLFDRIYNLNQIMSAKEVELIWCFLIDHNVMIEKIHGIVLSLPFLDQGLVFLYALSSKKSLDFFSKKESLWIEVIYFYIESQESGFSYLPSGCMSIFNYLIKYDTNSLLYFSLLRKGITL